MNRRNFINKLLVAGAAFAVLPPATTYSRVWRARRNSQHLQAIVDYCDGFSRNVSSPKNGEILIPEFGIDGYTVKRWRDDEGLVLACWSEEKSEWRPVHEFVLPSGRSSKPVHLIHRSSIKSNK